MTSAGAGDRLGLQCDVTGDSVPTAMLPYCGRTLLEGLLRDLQVRWPFTRYQMRCDGQPPISDTL